MNGYYWKHPKTGEWFWREHQKAEKWHGPFNSKKAAHDARAEFYENIINHSIDCSCLECEKIHSILREKEKKGEIYLSGTEEDKEKIRGERGSL